MKLHILLQTTDTQKMRVPYLRYILLYLDIIIYKFGNLATFRNYNLLQFLAKEYIYMLDF